MTQFIAQNSEVIIRLTVAIGLGMVIGAERLFAHKEAGIKTYSLVSIGAALFIIISEYLVGKYGGMSGFNASFIAGNIIVGIGFLGAGSIILQDNKLMGQTTAAGFWVTAGVGMACGFGLYGLAFIVTTLVLFILIVLNILEKPIMKRISRKKDQ